MSKYTKEEIVQYFWDNPPTIPQLQGMSFGEFFIKYLWLRGFEIKPIGSRETARTEGAK